MSSEGSDQKHGVPALLSLAIPGLGQIVKGETGKGIAIFLGTVVGYTACIAPGLMLHLWSIYDAYNYNPPRPRVLPPRVDIQVQTPEVQVKVGVDREATMSAPITQAASTTTQDAPPSTIFLKVLGTLLLGMALVSWIANPELSTDTLFWIFIGVSTALGTGLWVKAIHTDRKWKEKEQKQKQRLQEREVLQCAMQRGGRLTIAEVAAHTSLSLAEAKLVLERMAMEGHVGTIVSETGALLYEFFDLQKEQSLRLEPPTVQEQPLPPIEDQIGPS